MEAGLERAPIGICEVAPDGTVRSMNPAARDLLGIGSDATGAPIETVFPDSVEASVPRAFDSQPASDLSVEEFYPGLDRWLAVDVVAGDDAAWLYVRDATETHRTRQRLATLEGDLDRLHVVTDLIADVLGDLVEASGRQAIAETICAHLGETDLSRFAWVGERDVGTDDIAMTAAAGSPGRTGDRLAETLEGSASIPERRAVETGEPVIVQPLGEDERVPEAIRRAAFADGVQSLLAVPLTYGASVYGVVGVYAADQDAFAPRERSSFATLGAVAGFAITASRHRSLLTAETVVELTVDLGDAEAPLVAAAADHDATLSLTGLVPQGDRLRSYLAVEGASPGDIDGALAARDAVASTRVIADHGDAGSLEVALDDETPLGHVVTRGASVQSATFGSEESRLVIDVPLGDDVSRIADALTRAYDADVVAKREREREPTTARAFREAVDERLTDRQAEVLRTAFFADYFESPRGSTAEEVAEALDITGPTLLHHLRAGQRKLLAEFVDATDP